MQPQNINASIQLIPLANAAVAMPVIDEAIAIIKASGLVYEVGPFGTSVEGTFEQITQLAAAINSMIALHAIEEWVLNLQLHLRAGDAVTMEEKIAKHR